MDKLFNMDNPVMKFLTLVFDLLVLNVLWVICSIPIFTIGASTTALYYSCFKRIREDEGYTVKNFFHSFKVNFKLATLIWLILLLIGGLLGTDVWYTLTTDNSIMKWFLYPCIPVVVIYLMELLFVFPTLALFDNKLLGTIKNAFLFALLNLGECIAVIIIAFLMLAGAYFIGLLSALCLILGAATFAYLTSHLYLRAFKPYMVKKDENGNVIEDESQS